MGWKEMATRAVKYMLTPYDPASERIEAQRIKDIQEMSSGRQGGRCLPQV